MKYKMIVLDLDGTLTNSKKEITPRTYDALMEAQRRGVKIVLASGRPTYGIVPLARQLHLEDYNGYILAFNGGRIVNCSTGEVIFEQMLEPELVPMLYEETKASGLEILTYKGDGILATDIADSYVQHEAFINKMPLIQADDFLGEIEYPINKCLIVGEPTVLRGLEAGLAQRVEGKMSVYRSCDFFLECVPLGIDKAQSLRQLLARENMTEEEMVAFGDGHNDMSMIQLAGLGVAMANGETAVREAANLVTSTNEEDGVAVVVERLIKDGQI